MSRMKALFCCLAACAAMAAPASAQLFPGFPGTSSAPVSPGGIRQEGVYTTAPVMLDGQVLFRIASLTSAPSDSMPLGLRQSSIQNALAEIVSAQGAGTAYDPQSLRVQMRMVGDQALLEVVDAKHRDPLPLLTITTVDAKYHQQAVAHVAKSWQNTVQKALEAALRIREPAQVRDNVGDVVRLGIALVVLTLIVWGIMAAVGRKIAAIEALSAARDRELENEQARSAPEQPQAPENRRRFLALALRAASPVQRLRVYRAIDGILLWGTLLVWVAAITWGLSLFSQTTPYAHALARGALGVLAIWVVAGLLDRILDVVIARSATAWHSGYSMTAEERARQLLRIPTITQALAGFKTFVVVFLAALASLSQIGIPIGSVVTIGGVAALAVTFAAQNFVRDFVGGFLILFEDQYVVGDYVTINGHSGLVEQLTLRMVQIRDGAGNLITISHSAVTLVINQSRYWSRVDYRVSVDPAADISKALAALREAVEGLATDPQWRNAFLGPVEWIGVEAMTRDYVAIRASIKTAPLRQFDLRRELNARVQATFARAGVGFGAPLPETL
ncbi:MAG TPA: mechanosensitive ion channel family protein [Candidatus Baltobacteraceae bacterium]